MRTAKKKVKFPENLLLKKQLKETGRSLTWYAEKLGISFQAVSTTVNGHKKGINIVPKLIELLNQ